MSAAEIESHPPLFIAGCGRSGTTYLRTVVAAHPDIFIPNESLFIADYLRFGDALPRPLLRWLFYAEPQLKSWYDGPREPIENVARAVRKCHAFQAAAQGARIWGQKTPRFIRYIDDFERAFPGCKWMLIYRDPRAVVASHLKSPRHTYSVRAAARRWVRDNQPIARLLQSQSIPPNIMLVKYEDLILDFDAHLERLFRFVGVTSLTREEVVRQGKVAEFRGTSFKVAENNVRDGLEPQPKTIDAWKKQLSPAQAREIESICAKEMKILGYAPCGDCAADIPPRGKIETTAERLKDLGIVYQYMKAWPIYPIHTIVRKTIMNACRVGRRGAVSAG